MANVRDLAKQAGVSITTVSRVLNIPEQLSVIGFDDSDQRFSTFPCMSAVCQDVETLGSEAFRMLNTLIDQPGASPEQRKFECWLELHETTGPPGGG